MKVYKNESSAGAVICYVSAAAVLLLGVLMETKLPFSWDHTEATYKLFSLPWAVSCIKYILAAIFVIWCGNVLGREAVNFRRWHKDLVQHGRRSEGRVTEIICDKRISSTDSVKKTYRFRVAYYSAIDGYEKKFTTYTLNFVPKDGTAYLCDVYEMNPENHSNHSDNQEEEQEMIEVGEGRVVFHFNPFKLFKVVNNKSKNEDFGNVVADGFRIAASEECLDQE